MAGVRGRSIIEAKPAGGLGECVMDAYIMQTLHYLVAAASVSAGFEYHHYLLAEVHVCRAALPETLVGQLALVLSMF
jgi:hypothetical protein